MSRNQGQGERISSHMEAPFSGWVDPAEAGGGGSYQNLAPAGTQNWYAQQQNMASNLATPCQNQPLPPIHTVVPQHADMVQQPAGRSNIGSTAAQHQWTGGQQAAPHVMTDTYHQPDVPGRSQSVSHTTAECGHRKRTPEDDEIEAERKVQDMRTWNSKQIPILRTKLTAFSNANGKEREKIGGQINAMMTREKKAYKSKLFMTNLRTIFKATKRHIGDSSNSDETIRRDDLPEDIACNMTVKIKKNLRAAGFIFDDDTVQRDPIDQESDLAIIPPTQASDIRSLFFDDRITGQSIDSPQANMMVMNNRGIGNNGGGQDLLIDDVSGSFPNVSSIQQSMNRVSYQNPHQQYAHPTGPASDPILAQHWSRSVGIRTVASNQTQAMRDQPSIGQFPATVAPHHPMSTRGRPNPSTDASSSGTGCPVQCPQQ